MASSLWSTQTIPQVGEEQKKQKKQQQEQDGIFNYLGGGEQQSQAVTAPTPPSIPKTGQLGGDPNAQMLRSQQPASGDQRQTQPAQPAMANPWARWGLDPTKPVQAGMRGTREQALLGLQYAARQILGRDLTPQEWQEMASAIGYNGGSVVESAQYNAALSWINSRKNQQQQQQQPKTDAKGFQYDPNVNPMQYDSWGVQTPAPYQPTAPAPQQQIAQALPPHMRVEAQKFTQFIAPDLAPVDDRTQQLIQQVLENPETLNADVVNAMKSRSKESALTQAEQLRTAAAQDLARRGFSGMGGMQAAADAAVNAELIDNLIRSNRDIDILAAQQNRQDILNALQAADALQTSRVARAGDIFRNTLLGQQTEFDANMNLINFLEGQRQFDSDFDLRRWATEQAAEQAAADSRLRSSQFELEQQNQNRAFNLQEWLAREGVNLDNRRLAQAAEQFRAATGLDLLRLLENRRQFDLGLGENRRQFDLSLGEQARQHNNQLGFQYNQLGQTAQDNLIRTILMVAGLLPA